MNLDLKNRNALIGGGSQGLGFASAMELSLLGANCLLVSRNEENLKKAVDNLDHSLGQKHGYIVADYLNTQQALAEIDHGVMEFGNIHILVNNSGGPPAGNILDLTTADFENGFRMHFETAHELALRFLPHMRKEGYGRIINVLSVSVKQPIKELPVSNVIRAGIANWAKTLSNEVGQWGITVNNVLPGYTETERLEYLFEKRAEIAGSSPESIKNSYAEHVPLKRLGKPEEFGAVVAFLCSPAASYINGINLPVDGGATKGL